MRDLTGTRLGHHEVKERLGVGGMAVVFRAVQSSLGREVALILNIKKRVRVTVATLP